MPVAMPVKTDGSEVGQTGSETVQTCRLPPPLGCVVVGREAVDDLLVSLCDITTEDDPRGEEVVGVEAWGGLLVTLCGDRPHRMAHNTQASGESSLTSVEVCEESGGDGPPLLLPVSSPQP